MEKFSSFVLNESTQYVEIDAKGMHYMFAFDKSLKIKSVIDAYVKNLKKGLNDSFPDDVNVYPGKSFDPSLKSDQKMKIKYKGMDLALEFSYRTPGKIMKNDPEMFVVKVLRNG